MPYQICIAEQEPDYATKEFSRAARGLKPKVQVEQDPGKRFDEKFTKGPNQVHLLYDDDLAECQ